MNTEADLAALCDEFTEALTEVLAENAAAPARRPEYNEHAFCMAVETAFMQWEALQNMGTNRV